MKMKNNEGGQPSQSTTLKWRNDMLIYLGRKRKSPHLRDWEPIASGTPTIIQTTRLVADCDEPVLDMELTYPDSAYRAQITRQAFLTLLDVAREAGWAIG
jgi:hypothetical protein